MSAVPAARPLKQFITPCAPEPEVAAVVLHHNGVLVRFPTDFDAIASVRDLRLQRHGRPARPIAPWAASPNQKLLTGLRRCSRSRRRINTCAQVFPRESLGT